MVLNLMRPVLFSKREYENPNGFNKVPCLKLLIDDPSTFVTSLIRGTQKAYHEFHLPAAIQSSFVCFFLLK